MSGLPALPQAGAAIAAEDVQRWEQQVASVVTNVRDIPTLDEWRNQAAALETYLRGKDMQRPMLGAQRRIEARIGQLLTTPEKGGRGKRSEHAPYLREWLPEFRILAHAINGKCGLTDDEWRKSRRALVSLVRQRLGLIRETPPLPNGIYRCIVADPPWTFRVWSGEGKDRAAENHYPTMTQEEIEGLAISNLAANDCALFLWAVMPQLPEALQVIEAWGFEYKTCAFVWVKTTKNEQRFATGMGYWTRANAEICLLATKGSPQRLNADVHQVIQQPRREHSKKPDEAMSRIGRLVDGPYIELFARKSRPGWDCWGNEVA